MLRVALCARRRDGFARARREVFGATNRHTATRARRESARESVETMALVTLSVYDIKHAENARISSAVTSLNTLTRNALNVGGIFHGGVEVFGDEWSFGYCPEGSGVYRCNPRMNPMYEYRESVPLGVTSLSPARASAAVAALRARWRGSDYEVLERNCNHFCEALCEALGCEGPPEWLNAFANNANKARGAYQSAVSGVESAYESAVSGVAGAWAWLASGGGTSASSYASALESEGEREGGVVDGPRADDDDARRGARE
jgi:hypothetical protein